MMQLIVVWHRSIFFRLIALRLSKSDEENNLLSLKPDGKNTCLAISGGGAVPKRKPDVRFGKYGVIFEMFEGVGWRGDEFVGTTRVSNSVDFVYNNVLRSLSKARLVTENVRWPATSSAWRRTRPGAGRTTSPWRLAGTQSRTIRRGTVTPGSRGSSASSHLTSLQRACSSTDKQS